MFYVYILKSLPFNRLYIGMSDNVQRRLAEHNAGKVTSTQSYAPYWVMKVEKYLTKTEALRRERQIKKSGLLRKLIKSNATPLADSPKVSNRKV